MQSKDENLFSPRFYLNLVSFIGLLLLLRWFNPFINEMLFIFSSTCMLLAEGFGRSGTLLVIADILHGVLLWLPRMYAVYYFIAKGKYVANYLEKQLTEANGLLSLLFVRCIGVFIVVYMLASLQSFVLICLMLLPVKYLLADKFMEYLPRIMELEWSKKTMLVIAFRVLYWFFLVSLSWYLLTKGKYLANIIDHSGKNFRTRGNETAN